MPNYDPTGMQTLAVIPVGVDGTVASATAGRISGPADRTPVHTAPSATTTSGAMLAANTNRKAALLINIGTVDVFINLGGTAVANTGILLQSNGGSFSMSDMLGNLDNAVINGITASGTATVIVTEWT